MGIWGPGIFSNDVAADIRAEWREMIGNGTQPTEASEAILANHRDDLNDEYEAPTVWLALAIVQWKSGRPVENVQKRAIAVIDSGEGLLGWERPPANCRARERVLSNAREKLVRPPPPATRIRPRPRSTTPFEPGDLFAYRHQSGAQLFFWVSKNSSDPSGVRTNIELLDYSGETVPDIDVLTSLPAALRRYPPRPDGTIPRPDRVGFLLINPHRMDRKKYRLLAQRPRPANRPSHELDVVSPTELDRYLDPFIG